MIPAHILKQRVAALDQQIKACGNAFTSLLNDLEGNNSGSPKRGRKTNEERSMQRYRTADALGKRPGKPDQLKKKRK